MLMSPLMAILEPKRDMMPVVCMRRREPQRAWNLMYETSSENIRMWPGGSEVTIQFSLSR